MTETVGTEGELLPGTSYRLIKRLGGGGMGSVYIAEHTALGRRDAVKLLAPHIAEDEQAMKRLEREARATAALANPHIIDIYTLGVTSDKRPYVAMRLIQGRSLKEVIETDKRLELDRAWGLLRQVCVALQSAHQAGIVHRDLKPENLMVEVRDQGEFVTILDFGIAKVEAETESRLTQDGQVIGTPGYMAPEQALGRAVDGRADQYSIGAILYEMVSGGFPYDRMGALQTITQQITQDPRHISQYVTEATVPGGLQALIMRTLSREPGDRLHSLDAFVREVDAILGFIPPSTAPRTRLTMEAAAAARSQAGAAAGRRSTARVLLPVLAVAIGVGVGAAVFLSGSKATEPPSNGGTVTPPSLAVASPVPVSAPPSAAVAPSLPAVSSAPVLASAVASALASQPASATTPISAAERRPGLRPAGDKAPPTAVALTTSPPAPVSVAAAPPPVTAPPTAPPTAAVAAPPLAVMATPPTPMASPVPSPRLVIESPRIMGGGSGSAIKQSLFKAEKGIRDCVSRASGLTAGVSATITLVIDEDGFFGDPEVSGNATLGRCAAGAVKGGRLDRRPDTGGIRVTVPLRLEAP